MLTMDMILDARKVIEGVALETPCLPIPAIGDGVFVKTENLQPMGSFKIRAGLYKISKLTEEEAARGVITCSAGNFAQGVALAARERGIKAVICVPSGASLSKVEATKALGAEVIKVPGKVYDDAFKEAVRIGEERGMTFLHAFEDPLVIAGNGTIGLEILEQVPEPDIVLAPIGGGGLLSGISFAIKHTYPSCKVIGVQLEEAPCMYESRKQGKVITLDSVGPTMADGMSGRRCGDYTFELCNEYADDIVLVSDAEVSAALIMLLKSRKILVEGAGAAPTAAAMFGKVDIAGKRVVCVASGGNIDLSVVSGLIAKDAEGVLPVPA